MLPSSYRPTRHTTMAPNATRLAFWVTLGMRGTDVAQFEYADHVEVTLGLPRPLILHPAPATAQAGAAEVRQRFVMRFGAQQVRSVEGGSALTSILAEAGITHVHTLAGDCNSMPPELRARPKAVVLLVGAVFKATNCKRFTSEHRFSRISMSVPSTPGAAAVPVVPHMVSPLPCSSRPHSDCDESVNPGPTLRERLGIPHDATVFCRHGGPTSFNRLAAQNAVKHVVVHRPDVWFLFLATNRFLPYTNATRHIVHLNFSSSLAEKADFIRACDAMLHGRNAGESFGLAIAEFSQMRRAVFTAPAKTRSGDNFHLQALGRRAFVYQSTPELIQKLLTFNRSRATTQPWAQRAHWDAYTHFAPRHVMHTFACVFLHNGTCRLATYPKVGDFASARATQDGEFDPCAACSTYDYFVPWAAALTSEKNAA